ncbi:uncharacterized protein EV420DRAFT_1540016 [Desarmillaria tabescens]|uniref:F-box domain-containing protein n=1 Tax=Armillaria tabescens TaxID=1929756 RepID=A0AA39KI65_ARMTA|nr:uncharacterized protein EV420DRAFT_1540016 [Desarmillaria tabescens]KAK0459403.1 hypothetical protein EV420DRAFT_1540016 [Desarmillaria tabescens]
MKQHFQPCPRCGFDTNAPRLTNKPSPFHDLISVNGAASVTDASPVSHYLEGVHASISAQDDKIQHIKTMLKEAQEDRIRLQSVADSHAALISAFRKFPPEVLAEIFQYTIVIPSLGHWNQLSGDMTRVCATLCTLGGVCRHWRTTVLSTPSLWARFNIGWSRWMESRPPLLKTILDRSREAELSIGCRSVVFSSNIQNRHALLECVIPTSYRWKRALIELDEDRADIYGQIRGRLPLLEQLELSSRHFQVSWEHFRVFEDAPRLRELILGESLSPVHEFTLPWSQITNLYINHVIEPDDLRIVFSITPNLRFLRMSRQCNWEPEEPGHFIVCSSLRHLRVADLALFRIAILPSLEEICIDGTFARADLEADNKFGRIFRDFLDRSRCSIRNLKLATTLNADMALYNMFNRAPKHTCLDITLNTVYLTTRLIQLLTSDKILPQLQSLKVVSIAFFYEDDQDWLLGHDIAELFISRYLSSNANILLVHVEVPPDLALVGEPPKPVHIKPSPNGLYLSELFWTALETRLRDTRDLCSRIVTQKDEGRAIICMNRSLPEIY